MAAAAVIAREGRVERGGDHVGLARIQRARVIDATLELAAQHGAAGLSVAHIVERSGVSRRTFYDLFEDRRECVVAAFEDALGDVRREVSAAYLACGGSWRERVRVGLQALLGLFDREPALARFLVLEAPACGGEVLERRSQVLGELAAIVDRGRGESRGGADLPPLTGEGVVGGALAVLARALFERESLVELVNPLTAMVVLPYLGPAAARRELARPQTTVASDGPRAHVPVDPFKAAGMRLTYRTVRVLLAVAELGQAQESASNRVVGTTAGISDQGQISKLLGRLRRIGLIENSGLGPGQGAPNAWRLTETGRELTDRIREHTPSFR